MDPRQFDSLIINNQGFNTLNNIVSSNTSQGLAQQTLQSIQTMQTPAPPEPKFAPAGLCGVNPTQPITQNNIPPHQFYAVVNGSQKGPFSLEQLKGLAIADVLNTESMVWLVGSPEWTDLKTCLANLK